MTRKEAEQIRTQLSPRAWEAARALSYEKGFGSYVASQVRAYLEEVGYDEHRSGKAVWLPTAEHAVRVIDGREPPDLKAEESK